MPSQLANAVPVLESHSIPGTFFLSEPWNFDQLAPQFGALLVNGHEMASHTVKHSCDPELEGYTLSQMTAELDDNIQSLRAMGAPESLTFAYPCGQTNLGTPSESYIPAVTERFIAARGTAWGGADPDTVDLGNTPGTFSDENVDLVGLVAAEGEAKGGWLVFGFHGIGATAEWLPTAQDKHDALIAYLDEHRDTIWAATFHDVAAYIIRCR